MKKIFALSLLILCTPALAQSWVRYVRTGDANLYYDSQRTVVMGGTAFIWDLHDLKSEATDPDGQPYRSVLYATEYNCRKEQRRVLSFQRMSDSMGKGTLVSENSMVSPWVDAPSQTAAARLMDIACEPR